MGTPLGLKYIPYTYMDPLGKFRNSHTSELAPWCKIVSYDSYELRIKGFRV